MQLALIVAIYLGAAQSAEEATQVEIVDMSYVSTQRNLIEVSNTYLLDYRFARIVRRVAWYPIPETAVPTLHVSRYLRCCTAIQGYNLMYSVLSAIYRRRPSVLRNWSTVHLVSPLSTSGSTSHTRFLWPSMWQLVSQWVPWTSTIRRTSSVATLAPIFYRIPVTVSCTLSVPMATYIVINAAPVLFGTTRAQSAS